MKSSLQIEKNVVLCLQILDLNFLIQRFFRKNNPKQKIKQVGEAYGMLIQYTKRYLNIVSLIFTIVIYVFVNNSTFILKKVEINPQTIFKMFRRNVVQVELNSNNINQKTKEIKDNNQLETKEEEKEIHWKLIIPEISLEAEIAEGTSQNVMSRYVGHFEETPKSNGNVGLAAHNRGYEVNYFSELKKLKEGDEIIYKYYDFEKIYIVKKHVIISDEDWSYLEETEENILTLITCVENEPEYRRCIQAIEK